MPLLDWVRGGAIGRPPKLNLVIDSAMDLVQLHQHLTREHSVTEEAFEVRAAVCKVTCSCHFLMIFHFGGMR